MYSLLSSSLFLDKTTDQTNYPFSNFRKHVGQPFKIEYRTDCVLYTGNGHCTLSRVLSAQETSHGMDYLDFLLYQ